MKKKLVSIALVTVAAVSITFLSVSEGKTSSISNELKQTSMTDYYWQKTPCPVGFAGYICEWTNLSYPVCFTPNYWNCTPR